ncbi:MAG: hypothetical protein ACYDD4_13905, partial [Acidimicrobiales bacterium]
MANQGRPADVQARYRRRHVHVGAAAYLVGAVAVFGFVMSSPHMAHRTFMLWLDGTTLVATVGGFWLLGLRLVNTRWATSFFVLWTVSTFAFISAGAIVDGGTKSVLCYLLVLPLLFAGLAYPARTVCTLTAVGIFMVLAVGFSTTPVSTVQIGLLGTSMAVAGLLTTTMAVYRAELTAALVDAAEHDGLTGVLTRRAFYDRLL